MIEVPLPVFVLLSAWLGASLPLVVYFALVRRK